VREGRNEDWEKAEGGGKDEYDDRAAETLAVSSQGVEKTLTL